MASVAVSNPIDLTSTPPQSELAKLLDNVAVNSPSIQLASASHLTTSTPFHPGLNLSSVILNHLVNSPAISPLTNPDTSICPTSLDVSTVSPDLYKSVVSSEPIHCTPNNSDEKQIPPYNIELIKDYTHSQIISSHVLQSLKIPVTSDPLDHPVNVVFKITEIWINSTAVPSEFWCHLIDCNTEQVLTLDPEDPQLCLDITVKKAGLITINIGLVRESGSACSGLVRFQVEEPNVQILTDDGSRLDFGNVVEDTEHSIPFVIVNCGRSSVPLTLELKSSSDIFSLEGGEKSFNFTIPGVEQECNTPGQGVAKETFVKVNALGMSLPQTKVFMTQLNVFLGGSNSSLTLLGSLETSAKVGPARLKILPTQEPLVFTCVNGEAVAQKINLKNSGPTTMRVGIKIDESPYGKWLHPQEINIPIGHDLDIELEFICSASSPVQGSYNLHITILPGGPKHVIALQVQVLDTALQYYRSSRPALKLGTLKRNDKPDLVPNSAPRIPTVFPVESDRSHLNFLNVGLQEVAEQGVTLRNPTEETVTLTLIVRESPEFFIASPNGPTQSSSCRLDPLGTQDIRVLFKPSSVRMTKAKLVLKPQGRSVDGKNFKATISLCGYPGDADVNILAEGLTSIKQNSYKLNIRGQYASLDFQNNGNAPGFVKILCKGVSKTECKPSQFIIAAGRKKTVSLSLSIPQGRNTLQIFSGPELCRQVLKSAGDISSLSSLIENHDLLDIDFTSPFEGEGSESCPSQVTSLDVLQFFNKSSKFSVNLASNHNFEEVRKFEGLSIEDTLSETRIDQSIALPIRSSHQVLNFRGHPQPARVHSPPVREETQLQLHPPQVSLARGDECIVRLLNQGAASCHWDLSWPGQHLDISPSSGSLSPGGQAVLCIAAKIEHGNGPSQGAWKGQVSVYSDNEVAHLEVCVSPAPQQPLLLVTPRTIDLGSSVVGAASQGMLSLTNSSQQLIQWKGIVEPSFFSLPQSGGILNPGQAMNLPIHFKPAAPGIHKANLSLVSVPLRGNSLDLPQTPPITVSMSGTAITHTEVSTNIVQAAKVPISSKTATVMSKKSGGAVTLESEEIVFQDTKIGQLNISKVKIKNRSGCDQVLDIRPFEEKSPFRIGHTSVEVKNSCFTMLPVQFKPSAYGSYSQQLVFRYEGEKTLVAMLRGSCSGN